MDKIKAVGKLTAFSFVFFTLVGCSNSGRQYVFSHMQEARWSSDIGLYGDFYLFHALADEQNSNQYLNVVIEGDGYAWVNRFRPSGDPTPKNAVGFKIAESLQGKTAYLGRPCQYIEKHQQKNCHPAMWTNARFAEEVIGSLNQAITYLKERSNVQKIRLLGFSGGGALAALISGRRNDVIELITIAAPLDIDAWTRYHGISPLRNSANPVKEIKNWMHIPQKHFVGMDDEIVPRELYRQALKNIIGERHVQLTVIEGYGHNCCWDKFFSTEFH